MSSRRDPVDVALNEADALIGRAHASSSRYLRREPRNEVEAAHLIHEEHREADEWARSLDAAIYPACRSATSACRGGRRLCPTPMACRRPEVETTRLPARLVAVTVVFAVGAAIGLLLFWRH